MTDHLSRVVSRALRHAPDEYGIVLDAHGWTAIETLIEALRARGDEFSSVTDAEIQQIALGGERFEIEQGRIRACYGHSAVEIDYGPRQDPPPQLFHATSTRAFADIAPKGLNAGGRKHVHLTSSWDYASKIREQRKLETGGAVILVVAAEEAARRTGVPFYRASESIWVTPQVEREFISMAVLSRDGRAVRELRPLIKRDMPIDPANWLKSLIPDD